MEISVAQQASSLAGAILLGFAIGVLYDILRLLRGRLGLPGLGTVLDLLVWVVTVAALFLYAASATGGRVRI